MADLYLNVGEKKYPFSFEDLTVGRLRQVKAWFGPELGRYNSFIVALHQLDPDAALAAVWIARTVAGESNVPEPNQMEDFPLRGFLEDIEIEAAKTDPPTRAQPQTLDSTETQTNSGDDTSDS